jgi:hypothetical protein
MVSSLQDSRHSRGQGFGSASSKNQINRLELEDPHQGSGAT